MMVRKYCIDDCCHAIKICIFFNIYAWKPDCMLISLFLREHELLYIDQAGDVPICRNLRSSISLEFPPNPESNWIKKLISAGLFTSLLDGVSANTLGCLLLD
jgi:hypothetical protein